MSGETLLALAVLLPLSGALGIVLAGRWPNLREGVTLATAGALFLVIASLLRLVLAGERPALGTLELFGPFGLALAVEPLGMLFAALASTLWVVNSIYSIGYMRGNAEPRQTAFYLCFAVAIAGAMTVALAGNLVTLFLGYEVLTLSTYPLVTHRGTEEARRAGRVYLMMLIGSSMLLLLPAIVWTGAAAGTLDFRPGGIVAGAGLSVVATGVLLALFVFGIGKAAIMPGHFWLPAAMVAPTPVSALLHAVAVVKAGVFSIVKVIVYVFGPEHLSATGAGDWLLPVAAVTVVLASMIAMAQDNLKRRLAFSTVSQLSYVVMAAALFTPAGLVGAASHIAVHGVSKITLFFAAGSIYTAAHLTEIRQLDGIGRRMPWTMGAFAIGALSMIGVPPTAGFVSKWSMLTGGMAEPDWRLVGVILLSTCLNAAYFLPILWRAFFRPPPAADEQHPAHGEGPGPVVAALTATAAMTVGLFFFPGVAVGLAEMMLAVPE